MKNIRPIYDSRISSLSNELDNQYKLYDVIFLFCFNISEISLPLKAKHQRGQSSHGGSKQVNVCSEKRCSRLQTKVNRMNRMKYLVSSAVESKTSKGGSKQIHGDSEKKDIDNCKQRWKGLKIGARPGDQTVPRLSSECDIHWFLNADDPTYFEATNNLCIIDIVYIALRELHSYFSGAE